MFNNFKLFFKYYFPSVVTSLSCTSVMNSPKQVSVFVERF